MIKIPHYNAVSLTNFSNSVWLKYDVVHVTREAARMQYDVVNVKYDIVYSTLLRFVN